MRSHPASGVYKYRGLVVRHGELGVGITTLPCKRENCCEASKKFSRILWRKPRPKLGCGAKERKKERMYISLTKSLLFSVDACTLRTII
jgi:hypothetical protein